MRSGIPSTTVEGSIPAGVSKGMEVSTAVEVTTSETGGVAGSSVTGGADKRGVDGSGLDFQKKFLAPREALKAGL